MTSIEPFPDGLIDCLFNDLDCTESRHHLVHNLFELGKEGDEVPSRPKNSHKNRTNSQKGSNKTPLSPSDIIDLKKIVFGNITKLTSGLVCEEETWGEWHDNPDILIQKLIMDDLVPNLTMLEFQPPLIWDFSQSKHKYTFSQGLSALHKLESLTFKNVRTGGKDEMKLKIIFTPQTVLPNLTHLCFYECGLLPIDFHYLGNASKCSFPLMEHLEIGSRHLADGNVMKSLLAMIEYSMPKISNISFDYGSLSPSSLNVLSLSPVSQKLSRFDLSYVNGCNIQILTKFFSSVHIQNNTNIDTLSLDRISGVKDIFPVLTNSLPNLSSLKTLMMSWADIDDECTKMLCESSYLNQLEMIEITGCRAITPSVFNHIFNSPNMCNLKRMYYPVGHQFDIEVVKLLPSSKYCNKLESLKIAITGGNTQPISDPSLMIPFFSSPNLANLTSLEINFDGLGFDDIKALAQSQVLGNLTKLIISHIRVNKDEKKPTDTTIKNGKSQSEAKSSQDQKSKSNEWTEIFFKSPIFSKLEFLQIEASDFDDTDCLNLSESPYMSNIETLMICGYGLSKVGSGYVSFAQKSPHCFLPCTASISISPLGDSNNDARFKSFGGYGGYAGRTGGARTAVLPPVMIVGGDGPPAAFFAGVVDVGVNPQNAANPQNPQNAANAQNPQNAPNPQSTQNVPNPQNAQNAANPQTTQNTQNAQNAVNVANVANPQSTQNAANPQPNVVNVVNPQPNVVNVVNPQSQGGIHNLQPQPQGNINNLQPQVQGNIPNLQPQVQGNIPNLQPPVPRNLYNLRSTARLPPSGNVYNLQTQGLVNNNNMVNLPPQGNMVNLPQQGNIVNLQPQAQGNIVNLHPPQGNIHNLQPQVQGTMLNLRPQQGNMVNLQPQTQGNIYNLQPQGNLYNSQSHSNLYNPQQHSHIYNLQPQWNIFNLQPQLQGHIHNLQPQVQANIPNLQPQLQGHNIVVLNPQQQHQGNIYNLQLQQQGQLYNIQSQPHNNIYNLQLQLQQQGQLYNLQSQPPGNTYNLPPLPQGNVCNLQPPGNIYNLQPQGLANNNNMVNLQPQAQGNHNNTINLQLQAQGNNNNIINHQPQNPAVHPQ